jgi:hypothetical protein
MSYISGSCESRAGALIGFQSDILSKSKGTGLGGRLEKEKGLPRHQVEGQAHSPNFGPLGHFTE